MKKKHVVLSLLLVFVLVLAACNGQEEEEPAPTDAPVEQAPAEEGAGEAAPAEEAPAEEAAEAPAEEAPMEMESGLAIVDSVTVAQQGDQWVATVSGNLPDGCTEISGTSQSVSGTTISITVETQRPADMMCTQALTPYSEQVVLDTSGLEPGRYTVEANGVLADQVVTVGETAEEPASSGEAQILNIVWQWADLVETSPAAQSVVPNPENYTVTLLSDGRASLKADCNQVQVTYTLDGNNLTFNMLGPSTLAFCGEESLDTQFLGLLSSVNSWAMDGDRLNMMTSDGATMGYNNGGPAPGSVGIDPSQISLDTQGLPVSWQAVVVPLQPYDESMPPGPQGLPEHIEILFGVTDPAERVSTDPVMFIIPVDSYEAMYEANENTSVTQTMDSIAELTYALPEPAPTSGYPALPTAPYTPVAGFNDVAVQVGRASADEESASKNGFRFVGRWGQSPNPVTNQNLFYAYQGFTNDGEYLVSFFWPVSTEQLPATGGDVSQEDMDQFNSDMQAHMDEKAAMLNGLSTSDWQPDLATLDALVGSLQIEGMVASGVQEKLWQWTGLEAASGEVQPVESPTNYDLFFNVDGSFQFKADCNNGGGSYTVAGGFNGELAMQFGPITAAACEPESRFDEYLGYLQAVQDYRLQPGGSVLELVLPAGGGTLWFSEAGSIDIDLPDAETGETPGVVIAEAGANIRLGPGTGYPAIGVAPVGTEGTIIGVSEDGEWYAADAPQSPSLMGWVLGSLVAVENAEGLPVIPAPVVPAPTPVPTPVPSPSPEIKFWADATVIEEGACTGLHWSVENIQAVWVYPQGANYQEYPVTGQGSQSVCPTQTTTYVMRVEHTNGSLEYRSVTIQVNPKTTAGTSWVVASLYVNQVPIPGTMMTAYFGNDGVVSVNGGCNTYSGTYTENSGAISIGPLAGTQRSCGETIDAQEQAYLAALAAARTFVISGTQLVFYDSGVQEVVRFNFVQ